MNYGNDYVAQAEAAKKSEKENAGNKITKTIAAHAEKEVKEEGEDKKEAKKPKVKAKG